MLYEQNTTPPPMKKMYPKNVLLLKQVRKEVLYIYMFFFLLSVFFITFFNKHSLHLDMNRMHTNFLDQFFKYSTFLGDGIMFGVLVVVFFFIKRRMALVFLTSGVFTLLVIGIFKKVIFKGFARPAASIGVENLHLVDGVKMAFWNTFPSGHTTTAFAIFTILCLSSSKCRSQVVWVSLAIIAGISRVYLSQHYWIDIFVGSVLGIGIGFISMHLFYKKQMLTNKCS